MNKYFIKILGLTGTLCILFSGCNDKIEPGTTTVNQQTTINTQIAVAVIISRPFIYQAPGTITALDSTILSGKILGTVKEINVKEGDNVKKNETLIVLDERLVSAELRGSEAGLEEARKAYAAAISAMEAEKAAAQLALATYERYQKLYSEESATRQEFEEVEARHHQAKASLAGAEAMVDAALFRVQQSRAKVSRAGASRKDATIAAPYDGIVSAKLINVGDLASPGTPLLIIEKKGGFQAELVLPEEYIQTVRIGQKMVIDIPDQKGIPQITGIVRTIVPEADARTRSFLIKVGLPENPLIRSGMFARISVPVGEDRILLIPESAQVLHGQLTGYFMVDDADVARFRLMRTGRRFSDRIEVISGLKPGTRYVVSPPAELKNGMKLTKASQ